MDQAGNVHTLMRRYALAAAAAMVVATLTPAHAATSEPWGGLCDLTATGDTTWTGVVDAGPLVLGEDPLSVTRGGSIVCTVQVGSEQHGDDTNDTVAVSGPNGVGVLALPPTPVTYDVAPGAVVYLCTRVRIVDDLSYYYDAPTDVWRRGDSTARCAAVTRTQAGLVQVAGSKGGNGKPAHGPHTRRPDPGDTIDEGPPPTPVYPTGTIDITKNPTGPVTFAFSGFSPPVADWDCTMLTSAVSCTPPPAATGYANTCGRIHAEATSTGPGGVNAASTCGDGYVASARSTGPTTTPSSQETDADSSFPWGCTAAPEDAVTWTVRCTVGP